MLKINMEYRKGILFIRLKGSLTKYTYKSLNNYLLPLIEKHGIKYLVYNLSNLSLVDNYGKEAIKMGIDMAKKNEGEGLICQCNLIFKDDIKMIDDELAALKYIKI